MAVTKRVSMTKERELAQPRPAQKSDAEIGVKVSQDQANKREPLYRDMTMPPSKLQRLEQERRPIGEK